METSIISGLLEPRELSVIEDDKQDGESAFGHALEWRCDAKGSTNGNLAGFDSAGVEMRGGTANKQHGTNIHTTVGRRT